MNNVIIMVQFNVKNMSRNADMCGMIENVRTRL